jgi:hypothetical protein
MDLPALMTDGEYAVLPDDVRKEVHAWFVAVQPLLGGNVEGGMMAAYRRLSQQFNVSMATVRGKVAAIRTLGWRGAVNHAKVPAGRKLPRAFIEHWRRLCEENQRNCKQAYNKLVYQWKYTDEPIPGYETQPPASIGGIPRGWHYGNLMRYAPTKFELTAARVGRSAAATYRQKILTTRVGLEVMQYCLFDDLEHDALTNLVGVNKQARRPLELGAFDLFSGCKFAYGLKPILDGDDGAKQMLRGRDMRFLLALVLTQIGYRLAGTTFVVEWGTAAIQEQMEKRIFDMTAGAVTVQRSGIEGAPALHGWYEGRGKGNFRLKAAFESQHSLVHNVTAALPGQLGLDRNHSPEELHGRERVNKMLLKAAEALPPEKAALLRFPFIHFHQFHEILDAIYRLINARTDHDLEGFEAAGLITQEYRLDIRDKRWLPAASLDMLVPQKRDAVAALIERPGMTRCRKLAPIEVWEAGRKNLVKLPIWSLPSILGQDLAVERTVNDEGAFQFEDEDLSPDPLVYLAQVTNRDGHTVLLKDKETYLTFVNPFDFSKMIVCDARGGYIGTCDRVVPPSKARPEDLYPAMGEAAHTEKIRLAGFRARHAGTVAQRTEDEAWNDKVISGAPVLPEEIAVAARLRKLSKGSATEALAADQEQAAPKRAPREAYAISMEELSEL